MIFHIKGYKPKPTLSILFLALLLSSPVHSFEIKGISLGDSPQDIKRVYKADCEKVEIEYLKVMGDQSCYISNTSIAGAPISWGMDFFENRLWMASSSTNDSVFYERIRDALIGKFGEPDSITETILQNGFGVKFTNQIAVWENENAEMSIEKYHNNKLKNMYLNIESKAGRAIMLNRMEEHQKTVKPDI